MSATAEASALATRYQGDVSVDRPAQMPSWWQADWRSIDVSMGSWAARWDNLKQGVAGAIDHPSGPFAAAGIKSDDLDYRRLTPTYEAFVEVREGEGERARERERERGAVSRSQRYDYSMRAFAVRCLAPRNSSLRVALD